MTPSRGKPTEPGGGPPEEELVRRVQAGDDAAFQALFDRYVGLLEARARRWLPKSTRRKVSVSDVLQEARIVALRRCADFESRGEGSFGRWLLRIVELKVREAVRKYARTAKRGARRELSRGERADTAQFVARGPSPSALAIAAELEERARSAMKELPEDYRRILELVQKEGLTLAQAGERMGRSGEAARKLYGRALSRFAERVHGSAPEDGP